MNGYKAFYRGKSIEVYAPTSYQAQTIAAKQFKAKRPFDVVVIICERADGSTVVHQPQDVAP